MKIIEPEPELLERLLHQIQFNQGELVDSWSHPGKLLKQLWGAAKYAFSRKNQPLSFQELAARSHAKAWG